MREVEAGALDRLGFTLERPATVYRPAASGSLRAGAAQVDLTPALGLDSAGFGFPSSEHATGIFGRLRGTVLLLEGADGSRVALIGLDLLAGSRFLAEALAQRVGPTLGLGVDRLWLCASHTHNAPGHYFGDRFYDCLAARTNDFDQDLTRWWVDRLAAACESAAKNLVPARVGVGASSAAGLVWQRSLLAFAANLGPPGWMSAKTLADRVSKAAEEIMGEPGPAERDPAFSACDSRIQSVWAESLDGQPLGLFAIVHGTPAALPAHMALMTPDVSGVAARRLHHTLFGRCSERVPVAIVGGSMGDTNLVDPDQSIQAFRERREAIESLERREDLIDLTERLGRRLAEAVQASADVARSKATAECGVEVRFMELSIPGATGPGYRLPEKHQVGNAQFGGSELNQPTSAMDVTWWSLLSAPTLARLLMRWLVGEPSARRRLWWWPVPVRLPVWGDDPHAPKNHVLYDVLRTFGRRFYGRNLRAGDAFEPHLPVRHLRLGDDDLIGIPVEPSAMLTHRIRAAIRPDAPHRVMLLGLVSGYAGYATTVDEYRVQDYEGAATLWGRDFGTYVQAMVEAVVGSAARPPGDVVPGNASFDTDPREAGMPVSLLVPPRAMQPFTGVAEVRVGAMAEGVLRLPPRDEEKDRLVLWGWWFSDPPPPSERTTPLADRVLVRLEAQGPAGWTAVQWGPCAVHDQDVSFFLRRGISADLTRIRWVMSVRLPRDLLPDGTLVRLRVGDYPGLRPLEGSVDRPWPWSSEGRDPLLAS
ncbi:MAG: neutral/alkaline non-lysosomal ceramidase N-terminal domain-containing protein [Myxococcota bacterium]